MNNLELERLLNEKLSTDKINDYAPNGLQVEGKAEIKKIITGVTASQTLIDYAVAQQADAVLVHHGYFWKSENPWDGGKWHQWRRTPSVGRGNGR